MTIEPAITKLKNAAQLISEAVTELTSLLETAVSADSPATAPESPAAPETPAAPAEPKAPKLTLEDVRGALSNIARGGNREGVKALLEKYGASKLSAIDPNCYAALLKDAEELKNA